MSRRGVERRSSRLYPRQPGAGELVMRAIRSAPVLALSSGMACLALLWSPFDLSTPVILLNSLRSWVEVLTKMIFFNVLWVGLLGAMTEFQNNLSMTSELEDRIRDLLMEQLDHDYGSDPVRTMQDSTISLYLATISLEKVSWFHFLFTVIFKICATSRIFSLGWRVLEIISQTVWLESSWAKDNHISGEQTAIFMASFKGPCYFFFGSFVVNDICISLGLNTQTLMYSFLVGAGVLGACSQQVVLDFVASMHLLWGRPFEAGDAIAVKGCDKVMSVKSISYKYTKLLAMDGEVIIFPNHHIANTQITNFGTCVRRRRIFSRWKLSRDIPAESLLEVPQAVREIIETVDLKDLQKPQEVESSIATEIHSSGQARLESSSGNETVRTSIGSSAGHDSLPAAEYYTCWCQNIQPLHYVFELAYILVDIPDFRAAQHRMNVSLCIGLQKRGFTLVEFDKSKTASAVLWPAD